MVRLLCLGRLHSGFSDHRELPGAFFLPSKRGSHPDYWKFPTFQMFFLPAGVGANPESYVSNKTSQAVTRVNHDQTSRLIKIKCQCRY